MIDAIITALRARATSFGGRVAGAAEYKRLPEAANLIMPAAYVIPMDEDAGEQGDQRRKGEVHVHGGSGVMGSGRRGRSAAHDGAVGDLHAGAHQQHRVDGMVEVLRGA